MKTETARTAIILFLFGILSGCGTVPVEYRYPEKVKGKYEMPNERTEALKQDKLFGAKGFDFFSTDKVPETQIGVNSYLWQSALKTLSFMPLSSADPFGGVIITDWYSPPSFPKERFKLNVLILTDTLRADGLKVTVFRQVKDEKNEWKDIKSDPAVALRMENAILAGARRMRMSATGQ